jgi:hypothetical protein
VDLFERLLHRIVSRRVERDEPDVQGLGLDVLIVL